MGAENKPVGNGFRVAYRTGAGVMYQGLAEEVLLRPELGPLLGNVQLIFTSPPFPLVDRKRYGNPDQEQYADWLASYAPLFVRFLKPDGSIVIEVGNAWVRREPLMSTAPIEALLRFLKAGNLKLCQQFVRYNPVRPPSVHWVTVERIRVKDCYTNIWWMSPVSRPKADNRRVLEPYSEYTVRCIQRGESGVEHNPSGHCFNRARTTRDNGGAIPGNVLIMAGTTASNPYLRYCRERGLEIHPARMPVRLVEFFVKFLTDPGDTVLDPFAGSNTTGAVAEALGRRWVSIEPRREYIEGSKGWFARVYEEQDNA